jgi:hypothetical protein
MEERPMARKAQIPHLRIRIEPRLLARLEKSREKTGRTLTGEIVERLEASFQKEDRNAELEATAEKLAVHVINLLEKLPAEPVAAGELERAEAEAAEAAGRLAAIRRRLERQGKK